MSPGLEVALCVEINAAPSSLGTPTIVLSFPTGVEVLGPGDGEGDAKEDPSKSKIRPYNSKYNIKYFNVYNITLYMPS